MKRATKHTAAAILGKLGGAATTQAKREAARINGKKGGRPRKKRELENQSEAHLQTSRE